MHEENSSHVPVIEAREDMGFEYDTKGFFVIYIDNALKQIVVEHYSNVIREEGRIVTGKLKYIIRGNSAKAISQTVIREQLLSRMDHAFYLGRELQKAELALKHNMEYKQDGELVFR
ncbi:MAG: DUF4346 domain-containing protein [Thermoplasmata archaeon]